MTRTGNHSGPRLLAKPSLHLGSRAVEHPARRVQTRGEFLQRVCGSPAVGGSALVDFERPAGGIEVLAQLVDPKNRRSRKLVQRQRGKERDSAVVCTDSKCRTRTANFAAPALSAADQLLPLEFRKRGAQGRPADMEALGEFEFAGEPARPLSGGDGLAEHFRGLRDERSALRQADHARQIAACLMKGQVTDAAGFHPRHRPSLLRLSREGRLQPEAPVGAVAVAGVGDDQFEPLRVFHRHVEGRGLAARAGAGCARARGHRRRCSRPPCRRALRPAPAMPVSRLHLPPSAQTWRAGACA